MPSYNHRCRECGKITLELKRVENRNDPITCDCGATADRILTPVNHVIMFRPGYMASIGEHCDTEMEYYDKRSKIIDSKIESLYGGDGGE